MSANKIFVGLIIFGASHFAHTAPSIQECVGPICVNGKENFFQFKQKWKAYTSSKLTRESASYPSLCLWNKKNGISYVFYFIGRYGTTDEPISHSKLGEITIAKSTICKKENVVQLPSSLGQGMSRWIGRDRDELITQWGQPNRIDDGKDFDIDLSDLKGVIKEVYFYFLDEEKELLFNAFGIDDHGKIMKILISDIP